jgi:formylmethanofuran dehydrogenase subunit D
MVSKKIEVTLVSGRSLQQGIGLEIGKSSKEYINSVTYVEISQKDSDQLELKKDSVVEIATIQGKINLYWRLAEGLPPGLIFVPYGLWINQIIGTYTTSTGTPNFKSVKATISAAADQKVLTYSELIKNLRGES